MELIEVYTENSATQILKINQAAARGDLKEVSAQAHSLKSSSANMGAMELSEVCLHLEKAKAIDSTALVWVKNAEILREQAVTAMNEWKIDKSA
jgi:HPt (histidine-containing phosphotransfer) domain-containing protein